jgi:pimeloyl-ACP methyl ester carboxylesterase
MKSSASHKGDWRYWRNLGVFALGSCGVGYFLLQFVAFPVISAYGYSHPQRLAVCCYTPADLGLIYEDVSFTTIDNLTLHGWYIPSQNQAAIILLHPLASNRMGTLEGAKMLAKHGYGLLLLDLRAHGESDGELFPYGGPEVEDLRGAITYLQNRTDIDPTRIGVMGWSLGGQVGILGAANLPAIKAVVADGPGATALEDWPPPRTFGEWLYLPVDIAFYQIMPLYTGVPSPLSIKQAIGQIAPRPILLISADFELEKHRMEYFLNAAQEPKSLWVIPGANHIEGISKSPQAYEEKVVKFFNEALLGISP